MQAKQIARSFYDAWNEFGDDKSTEFLLSITSDRCACDYMDVVDALTEFDTEESTEPA